MKSRITLSSILLSIIAVFSWVCFHSISEAPRNIENDEGNVVVKPKKVETANDQTLKKGPSSPMSSKVTSSKVDNLLYQSANEIVAQLESFDIEKDGQRKFLLYTNLVELLKHKPQEARSLKKKLLELSKNRDNYSREISVLLGALASAQGPTVDKTIRDLLTQRDNQAVAFQSALVINHFKTPSQELVRDMQEIIADSNRSLDLRKATRLALGSVASRIETQNPQLRNNILNQMVEECQYLSIDEMADGCLGAFGNAGFEGALPLAKRALSSESPYARARAFYAMRSVKSHEAQKLFRKAWQEERNLDVLDYGAKAFESMKPNGEMLQTVRISLEKVKNQPAIFNRIIESSGKATLRYSQYKEQLKVIYDSFLEEPLHDSSRAKIQKWIDHLL